MEYVGGTLGAIGIAVVVALGLCLAVLHFRYHIFRRRKSRVRGKAEAPGPSRVEVLETTVIDTDRKLVLIRCDRIEHLIMVGGPADLVVENDVRKVRGPGAPPAKIPGFDTPVPSVQRAPTPLPAPEGMLPAPSRAVEPTRGLRPPVERPAAPASARMPAREPAATRPHEQPGRTSQRAQPVDLQPGRRDLVPSRRPAPQPVSQPAASVDRHARGARGARVDPPAAALPAAQIPWSDPDSIENEIVRALRFDPQVRPGGPQPSRREPPALRATTDSQTTLGDLADRLEEALAREVQSASHPRRTEPAVDDFGFDNAGEPAAAEAAPQPAPQSERQDRRDRADPPRSGLAPAPEPEQRREAQASSERREEAPVISLNARRRESADQLEDEMARLLGELTSDNKGR